MRQDVGSDNGPAGPDPTNPTNEFFIFVDGTNGNSGGAGTKEDPVDTVQAGIDLAAAGSKWVAVAEGTYDVDSTGTSGAVQMTESVDVYGGYRNTSGSWSRAVGTYTSTLRDVSSTGGRTVLFGFGGGGRDALLDGFTVTASDGTNSTAIHVDENTPATINQCVITMGSPSGTAYGIRTQHSSGLPAADDQSLVTVTLLPHYRRGNGRSRHRHCPLPATI